MAKYARQKDLIATSLSFKMFGKRYCDLTKDEKREYFRERKRASRFNMGLREEKDYLRGY